MLKEDELDHSREIGMLKSEVHTLNTLVSKLFEKFDAYVEKTQPKAMSAAGYIGIALSILSILAIIFSSMIYMTNSSNAPLASQLSQISQIIATIQNNTLQNSSQGQLTGKEITGLAKSVNSNEETLRWMIFTENLPKQITETQGRLNTIELQIRQLHKKEL